MLSRLVVLSALFVPALAFADVAPGGCRCDVVGLGAGAWLVPVALGLALAVRRR